jgi:hypothetical protein
VGISEDSWAFIDPHPDHPGYWFVTAFNDCGMTVTTRACKLTPGLAQALLRKQGFAPSGIWQVDQAFDGPPPWIAELFPEWVRWAQSSAKSDYLSRHGSLPKLDDDKFWAMVQECIAMAEAAVTTPAGGDTAETFGSKYRAFCSAWESKFSKALAA